MRFVLSTFVLSSAAPSNAGLLDEAWGVVIAPLNVEKGTEDIGAALERALNPISVGEFVAACSRRARNVMQPFYVLTYCERK